MFKKKKKLYIYKTAASGNMLFTENLLTDFSEQHLMEMRTR